MCTCACVYAHGRCVFVFVCVCASESARACGVVCVCVCVCVCECVRARAYVCVWGRGVGRGGGGEGRRFVTSRQQRYGADFATSLPSVFVRFRDVWAHRRLFACYFSSSNIQSTTVCSFIHLSIDSDDRLFIGYYTRLIAQSYRYLWSIILRRADVHLSFTSYAWNKAINFDPIYGCLTVSNCNVHNDPFFHV